MTAPRHLGYQRRRNLQRLADDMRRQQQRDAIKAHARLMAEMQALAAVTPALVDPADLFDSAADADGQLALLATGLH